MMMPEYNRVRQENVKLHESIKEQEEEEEEGKRKKKEKKEERRGRNPGTSPDIP